MWLADVSLASRTMRSASASTSASFRSPSSRSRCQLSQRGFALGLRLGGELRGLFLRLGDAALGVGLGCLGATGGGRHGLRLRLGESLLGGRLGLRLGLGQTAIRLDLRLVDPGLGLTLGLGLGGGDALVGLALQLGDLGGGRLALALDLDGDLLGFLAGGVDPLLGGLLGGLQLGRGGLALGGLVGLDAAGRLGSLARSLFHQPVRLGPSRGDALLRGRARGGELLGEARGLCRRLGLGRGRLLGRFGRFGSALRPAPAADRLGAFSGSGACCCATGSGCLTGSGASGCLLAHRLRCLTGSGSFTGSGAFSATGSGAFAGSCC